MGLNEDLTAITSDDDYIYVGTNKGSIWRIDPQSICPPKQASLVVVASIENQFVDQIEIITPSLNNTNTKQTKQIAIISHSTNSVEFTQLVVANLDTISENPSNQYSYVMYNIHYTNMSHTPCSDCLK